MSDSPFAAFANATLRFEVASGALVADPATGNKKPGKAIVEVLAMLDQERSPVTETQPGVDSTAVYLEGFVVEVVGAENPLRLPSIVSPSSPCAATWDSKMGRFFLQLKGHSPFGYESVTGDELQGYFQVSKFTVEGDPWTPSPEPETASTKIPFSYGDASPKVAYTIAAGTTVFTAQIVIDIPFNGAGPALALGDAEMSDRLISVAQNDPTYKAEYEANPGYTYSTETEILLTITPGEGCTQGSGYILLEV